MTRQKRLGLIWLLLFSIFLVACADAEDADLDADTPVDDVSVPGEGGVGDLDEGVLAQDQEVVDEDELLPDDDDPFLDASETIDEPETELLEDEEEGVNEEDDSVRESDEEGLTEDEFGGEADSDPGDAEGLVEEEQGFLEEQEDPISLAELEADPTGYLEQEVLVEDEITRSLPPLGFTLGEAEVLVLSADPAGFDDALLNEGNNLRLRGVVREFDRAVIEEELGAELDEDTFGAFQGRPVLIVDPDNIDEGL